MRLAQEINKYTIRCEPDGIRFFDLGSGINLPRGPWD